MKSLRIIESKRPASHRTFMANLKDKTTWNERNGAAGLHNLALCAMRAFEKMKKNELPKLVDPKAELGIKLDMGHHGTRSVEVMPYEPDIERPNISKIKLDLPNVRVEKRMLKNGDIDVNYYYTTDIVKKADGKWGRVKGKEQIAFSLLIYGDYIDITKYWMSPSPTTMRSIAVRNFEKWIKANPFWLHTI